MDQYISLIALTLGVFIGYFLTRRKDQSYNDMKDFATAYSNLSTQLINAIRHQVPVDTRPQEEPYLKKPQQKDTDIPYDLLGGTNESPDDEEIS